jgi:hypothetical protein
MPQTGSHFSVPAPLIAVAGWIVPGAGYALIGQRLRGLVIGVTIIAMFAIGLLIAGIRVIDVPGFDDQGRKVELDARGNKIDRLARPEMSGDWVLTARPFAEIANKPWFVGQVLAGPICLVAAHFSLDLAQPVNPGSIYSRVPKSHARLAEIGTLYTAVAGMLNLLAIIDSSYRASQEHGENA